MATLWCSGLLAASGCVIQERTDRPVDDESPAPVPERVQRLSDGLQLRGGEAPLAVRSGDFVHLSGMMGTLPGAVGPDGAGVLADGGVRAETRQAISNAEAVLAEVGATLDDVVRCTVFLADLGEYDAMNFEYLTRVTAEGPARSVVGVGRLPLGARVLIECTAYVPTGG